MIGKTYNGEVYITPAYFKIETYTRDGNLSYDLRMYHKIPVYDEDDNETGLYEFDPKKTPGSRSLEQLFFITVRCPRSTIAERTFEEKLDMIESGPGSEKFKKKIYIPAFDKDMEKPTEALECALGAMLELAA